MGERRLTEDGAFSVIVIDMAHYDQTAELCVRGFPSLALAGEYARRRTRASLEESRSPNMSPAELRSAWYIFGEDCIVVAPDGYRGASEIDFFIMHPATPDERDWPAIETLVANGQSH